MIKIKIAKFIMIFALALVSINACYPSDYECADNIEIKLLSKSEITKSHQESTPQSKSQSSSETESHYCLCSLTCHTMFMSFSSFESFASYELAFFPALQYTPSFYPELSYSLEKPPTV